MLDTLKESWGKLPKWAKIGVPVAAVGLFVLARMRSGSGTVVSAGTALNTAGNAQATQQAAQQAAQQLFADYKKTTDAELASKLDTYTAALESQITTGLETALTAFHDDLAKKAAENQTKVDSFSGLVNQIVGSVNSTTSQLSAVTEHVNRIETAVKTAPVPSTPNESDLLAKALQLSNQWWTADPSQRESIHTEAAAYYKAAGASYNDATGEWTKNGRVLN